MEVAACIFPSALLMTRMGPSMHTGHPKRRGQHGQRGRR